MSDDVLTTTAAAKLLGISVRTAQLLIESGGLPSWKTPGGHRRVHRADVVALLPGRRPPARPGAPDVLVVSDEARRQAITSAFGPAPFFAVEFLTDLFSAALAVGQRLPGIVAVDVAVWGKEGLDLLSTLAGDARLQETGLLAVDAGPGRAALPPSRVRRVSLGSLSATVDELLRDADAPPQVLQADHPLAPNEASRLQAVQRSGLDGSAPEVPFDRLTSIATDSLHSPVALMTVLSADRQWFKARHGLELTETPRSWAFCNHTLLQRGVFEVRDLAADARFSGNPAVSGAPHFRHYAGAPVYDPRGFALGSICVMDFRPRKLSPAQRQTLLHLAAIASDAVKLRSLATRH